jgi:ribosomal protein L17
MQTRSSGFTRIIKIGFRRGDGAGVSILEIVE